MRFHLVLAAIVVASGCQGNPPSRLQFACDPLAIDPCGPGFWCQPQEGVGYHGVCVGGEAPGGADVVTGADEGPVEPDLLTDADTTEPYARDGVASDARDVGETGEPDSGFLDFPSQDEMAGPDQVDVADPALQRSCDLFLTFRPPSGTATQVEICGPWNDWACEAMTGPGQGGQWVTSWTGGAPRLASGQALPPGEYPYKFRVNGAVDAADWYLDPENPLVFFEGGVENSKLIVPDCLRPAIEVVSATADWGTRSVSAAFRVKSGQGGKPVPLSALSVEIQGKPFFDWSYEPGLQRLTIARSGLSRGKHTLKITVDGADHPAVVPLWLEPTAFAWRDAIVYSVVTDRFSNGTTTNDAPAACVPTEQKAKNMDWRGGDWAGVRNKIEEGWFEQLGVNTLLLSAPNENTEKCFSGTLSASHGAMYTAFGGGYAVSLDAPESHFGTLAELRSLVQSAHDRGIRVLMDFTPNHVYLDAPMYQQHKDWFNPGTNLCNDADNWNTHPEDCWFGADLPDIDYRSNDAVNAVTDALLEWAISVDLDGFRLESPKHFHQNFGRTLRFKCQSQIQTAASPFYLVGETFVSDWDGGGGADETTLVRYISSRELDGQYNYPLYWETTGTLLRGEGQLGSLGDVVRDSLAFYHGAYPNVLMVNFVGSRWLPRAISHAAGTISDVWGNGSQELGWTSPPGAVSDATAFRKVKAAFALVLTIPGVPMVYYGDEAGLPGAGAPDNQRMMEFSGLDSEQTKLRSAVSALVGFRSTHPATRQGTFVKLWGDSAGLAYAMKASDGPVIVVINGATARTIQVPLASLSNAPSQFHELFTGASVPVSSGSVSAALGAWDTAVLAP